MASTRHQSLDFITQSYGWSNPDIDYDLKRALQALQGWRQNVITGGASGASVSLPAYVSGDVVLSIVSVNSVGVTAQAFSSHTDFSHAATFAIKQNSNAASGLSCLVTWLDRDGGAGVI